MARSARPPASPTPRSARSAAAPSMPEPPGPPASPCTREFTSVLSMRPLQEAMHTIKPASDLLGAWRARGTGTTAAMCHTGAHQACRWDCGGVPVHAGALRLLVVRALAQLLHLARQHLPQFVHLQGERGSSRQPSLHMLLHLHHLSAFGIPCNTCIAGLGGHQDGWQRRATGGYAHLGLHEHEVLLLPVDLRCQLIGDMLQDVLQVPCDPQSRGFYYIFYCTLLDRPTCNSASAPTTRVHACMQGDITIVGC